MYGLAVTLDRLPLDGYDCQQAVDTLIQPCTNCRNVITTRGEKVDSFADDIPDSAFSGGGRPTSPGSERASGLNIALPTHAKRPASADDIAELEAKRAKGWKPEITKKKSVSFGKGETQAVVKISICKILEQSCLMYLFTTK